jgi:hypothetical protein
MLLKLPRNSEVSQKYVNDNIFICFRNALPEHCVDCFAHFVSLSTCWNLSRKMSACFGVKISAGRNLIESSPHPPVCTPVTLWRVEFSWLFNSHNISCAKCFHLAGQLKKHILLTTNLLHGAQPFLQSWQITQLIMKFPTLMVPEGSLPHSWVHTLKLYFFDSI